MRTRFFAAVSMVFTLANPAGADPLSLQGARSFSLWQSGLKTGCTVRLEPASAGAGMLSLVTEGDCAALNGVIPLAGLAREHDDGSLIVIDGGDRALLVLAPGEGFDYEAVEPSSAMLALAAD